MRVQPAERVSPVQRHQAGVAGAHREFDGAGVLVLANRFGAPCSSSAAGHSRPDRPARSRARRPRRLPRVFRADGRKFRGAPAACRRTAPARRHSLRRGRRGPPSTAWAVPSRSACTKIRASGAAARASAATSSRPGPTTTASESAPARADGIEHMGEHGAPRDLVQHFWQAGAHALALAGGENDGEAAAFGERGVMRPLCE